MSTISPLTGKVALVTGESAPRLSNTIDRRHSLASMETKMHHEVSAIPITVAVLFHSGFGHTARQAEAVRRGIERVAGASALYLTSDEAQGRFDVLELADAIIFGAPTYMGSVSGPFKTFMDSTSKAYARGAWKDKIAAGFTNSASRSGDKLATLTQFAILAAQHGMHWVNLGLPAGNNSTHGSEQDLNRLGFWLGAAAQSNADQGPDFAPPESDLLTAEHLGERVSRVTQQFVRGRLPAVKGLGAEMSYETHHDRVRLHGG